MDVSVADYKRIKGMDLASAEEVKEAVAGLNSKQPRPSDTLSARDIAKVQGLDINADAAIREAIDGPDDARRNDVAGMLGAGYPIGSVLMPPITPGVLPLLEAIGSPFLGTDTDDADIGLSAIMETVYVLCRGADAARPILGLQRRKLALKKHERIAEKSPEFFREFLAASDRIASEWAAFQAAAVEFWADVGQVDLQDVADTILRAFNDAFAGFATLPQQAGAAEKKMSSMTPKN